MKHSISISTILRGAAAFLSAAILLPVLSAGAVFTPAIDPGDTGMERILWESAAPEAGSGSAEAGLVLSLEDVKSRLESSENERVPHIWPVRFSEAGYISSYFGSRIDPVTGEDTQFHGGIDLADKPNTKIHAAAAGTVVEATESSGYGLTLLIDHGNGYQSRYSHCSGLLVEEGDEVSQGQIIATMGATGRVTGVHLDFRISLDGELIDPLKVLDPAEA